MKGALSQDTARLMVFELVMAASKSWRRLQGQNQLPKIIAGETFLDGIEVAREDKAAARFTPSPKIGHSSMQTFLDPIPLAQEKLIVARLQSDSRTRTKPRIPSAR